MRRRSRVGGEPIKTRRRKAAPLKRGSVPKDARRRSSSAAGREAEVARLARELNKAAQQQTATADVLKVISRSTFDLQAVLNTVVETAARLCGADKAAIQMRDGQVFRIRSNYGYSREALENALAHPLKADRSSTTGRVAMEGKAVHICDVLADPEYRATGYQQTIGFRTILGVPLLRRGTTIGVFALSRDEVNPFTEKQIELVTTFADQAVIAIENARLLNELRQRTDDLTESLEQQTATSNVLEVISRSAFDLNAVFETVVESSARLCGADRAMIHRFDGEVLRIASAFNASQGERKWMERNPIRPGQHSGIARAALERRTIHNPDVQADPEHTLAARRLWPGQKAIRTILWVPILKGDDLLGVMTLYHMQVRPFTQKQIALVGTFADQAAIAIENVRLFEAEQQRTRELTESLGQQTATAEVLRVISASPGDLEPVFEVMLSNATRICGAKFGVLFLAEGDGFRPVAFHGALAAFVEAHRRMPVVSVRSGTTTMGRVAATKQPAQVADIRAEPAYTSDPERFAILNVSGARTMLNVPMLKENELVGQIAIYRQEVRPFTDKQIELLRNFAAQAVIAIENARLLNELRESLCNSSSGHCRRTQGHQPLGVRSASRTRYACWIGRPAV